MDLIVSILIVLDDALVHLKIKTTHLEVYLVSILIVLDDALVRMFVFFADQSPRILSQSLLCWTML